MLLKNVQKKAAELNHLKCELIITDVNGKSFKSFFRNVEFIIWGQQNYRQICTVFLNVTANIRTKYVMPLIYARYITRISSIKLLNVYICIYLNR